MQQRKKIAKLRCSENIVSTITFVTLWGILMIIKTRTSVTNVNKMNYATKQLH